MMSGLTFGHRLRRAREHRDCSQDRLANSCGIPPSAISHFEADRRKPSYGNLCKISKALGVSADFLLGITNDISAKTPAGSLYALAEALSARDRDLAEDFLRLLGQRRKRA
jgi:transcriptional regulator with XRE-family HTH domain